MEIPADVEQLRQHLEDLRVELTESVRHAAEDGGELSNIDSDVTGRLSRADAMQREELARETNRRREQDLQRVKGALQRIKDGEYGDCPRCGQHIAAKRLQADPAATLCIDCANALEQG